jgi:hypothetical protein
MAKRPAFLPEGAKGSPRGECAEGGGHRDEAGFTLRGLDEDAG